MSKQQFLVKQHKMLIMYMSMVLLVLFFASLFIGRISTPLNSIFDSSSALLIIRDIRLPRIIAAIFIGIGLAGSGAVYQALFRNPLVSPDILGVTSGCTLGAALAMVFSAESFFLIQITSFTLGLISVFIALYISKIIAPNQIVTLILSGIIISAIFSSLLLCIKYAADPYDELPAIIFWIMGGLYRVGWTESILISSSVFLGGLIIFKLRFRLNVLSLGETQATSLGVNFALNKILFVLLTSIIISLIVSSCGQIGWIALVVPHLSRSLVGPDHKKMIPIAMLAGAIMMLIFDNLARSLTAAELPISIFTSLIGAPIFAIMLIKNRGAGWS